MYKLLLPDHVVSGLRICSLMLFLLFAVDINRRSILAALVLIGKY